MSFSKEEILDGKLVLIDKPLHWTSFDVVNKIRYSLKKHLGLKKVKVGHAGTLDPLASGLLILCLGKMTKQIEKYMGLPKTYTGTFTLGSTTPSYDLETRPDAHFPTEHLTAEMIHRATGKFQGEIMQKPPAFSAIKKGGIKSYTAARKGDDLKLEARPVHIHSFEIEGIKMPEVYFKVECSKGTYIRSLAFDFGRELQSGAHLSALRRTGIGHFKVEKAQSLEGFLQSISS